MSQFDNSEVMIKYASLMQDQKLIKTAWTWEDVASAIGVDVALGAGIGALTGSGVTAGALGALGVGLPPVGIALALGGLGASIYFATRQSDNNVEDLIDRLEDLDTNSRSEGIVQYWINTLRQFQGLFKIEPSTTDPEATAIANAKKITELEQLKKFLESIQRDWPRVESNLDDWGADPRQAQYAIQQTSANVQQMLNDIGAKVRQAEQKIVEKYSKETGVDYSAAAKEVVGLYDKLTEMAGKPPKFDTPAERSGYDLAKQIVSGEAKGRAVQMYGSNMMELKKLMEQGVQMLSKKTSTYRPYISKRALTLGDGTRVDQPGVAGKQSRRRGGPVADLQRHINTLNQEYETGARPIRVDNIYGPRTAAAFRHLVTSVPEIKKAVLSAGVPLATLSDPKEMRGSAAGITDAVSALGGYARKARSKMLSPREKGKTKERSKTKTEPRSTQYGIPCDPYKADLNGAEIMACLSLKSIYDPRDKEYYPALQWLETRGFRDPNTIVEIIQKNFSDPGFGVAPSSQWDMGVIYNYVTNVLGVGPGRYHLRG